MNLTTINNNLTASDPAALNPNSRLIVEIINLSLNQSIPEIDATDPKSQAFLVLLILIAFSSSLDHA